MITNNEDHDLPVLTEPDEDVSTSTIDKRQAKQKDAIIKQLRKTPIVQLACELAGIGRTTYYRWRKEDEMFAQNADEAINDGSYLINDLAESQLLNCIREKELGAITFWLKHHHPTYSSKIEITGKIKHEDDTLSPEQETIIKQALKLAGLEEENYDNSTTNNNV